MQKQHIQGIQFYLDEIDIFLDWQSDCIFGAD